MTKALILVGIGGGLGSILRYLTSVVFTKYFPLQFPLGTFSVNIIGCLLIGIILGLFDRQNIMNQDLRLFLTTGFCGGFTTFSAFASENIQLIHNNHTIIALLYISASITIGLLAVWAGIMLTK